MKVPVRRVDKKLSLPEYKTPGAAAMDCVVREDIEILPKSVSMVPLNIALKPPKGHFVLLVARSSLHKRGLVMANGIGIGDEDFSGDNDEYQAALYNFIDAPVQLKKGDRILQMIILPFDRIVWNEVDSLGNPNRKGFGTTGL